MTPPQTDLAKPRVRHPWMWRFGLLGISLLISLTLAEGVTRLTVANTELEFITDDDELWCPRPAQVVRDRHGRRVESINSLGLRGGEPGPESDRTRVLMLGCSMTYGSGVSDEETFSAALERKSAGAFEVINAGVPGFGLFQVEARMRRLVDVLEPDLVIVTVLQGAVLRQPFSTDEAKQEHLSAARFRQTVRKYSRFATIVGRKLQEIKLAKFGQATPNARVQKPAPQAAGPSEVYQECWREDRERLVRMKTLAEARGIHLLVVGWPSAPRNQPFFDAELQRLAVEDGFNVISLTDVLAAHGKSRWAIPNDGHPNPFGHQLAADEIYEALKPLALVPEE